MTAGRMSTKVVYLRADEALRYGKVIEVVDIMKTRGRRADRLRVRRCRRTRRLDERSRGPRPRGARRRWTAASRWRRRCPGSAHLLLVGGAFAASWLGRAARDRGDAGFVVTCPRAEVGSRRRIQRRRLPAPVTTQRRPHRSRRHLRRRRRSSSRRRKSRGRACRHLTPSDEAEAGEVRADRARSVRPDRARASAGGAPAERAPAHARRRRASSVAARSGRPRRQRRHRGLVPGRRAAEDLAHLDAADQSRRSPSPITVSSPSSPTDV